MFGQTMLWGRFFDKLGLKYGQQRDENLSDIDLIGKLEAVRREGDRARALKLLLILGGRVYNRGEHNQAEQFYLEGLELARQLDDQEKISLILINMGSFAAQRADSKLAFSFYTEALDIARRLCDKDNVCYLLANLGTLAQKQGKLEEAHDLYKEGIIVAVRAGNHRIANHIKPKKDVVDTALSLAARGRDKGSGNK